MICFLEIPLLNLTVLRLIFNVNMFSFLFIYLVLNVVFITWTSKKDISANSSVK